MNGRKYLQSIYFPRVNTQSKQGTHTTQKQKKKKKQKNNQIIQLKMGKAPEIFPKLLK